MSPAGVWHLPGTLPLCDHGCAPYWCLDGAFVKVWYSKVRKNTGGCVSAPGARRASVFDHSAPVPVFCPPLNKQSAGVM